MIPTKIGVVPSTSPTVEALVRWTEVTNEIWFSEDEERGEQDELHVGRAIRNERSRHQVKAQKSTIAAP